jgi:ferredoxin-NADP reductase
VRSGSGNRMGSGMQVLTARLLEFRDLGPQVRHFVFEVEDCPCFSYVPGQFVSFTAPIDGNEITRAYSIASPPAGNRFELCLNLVEQGHFSPYLFDLQPGGQVRMTGPWGAFIFRPPVLDSVLIATGTGIAPFRAMLAAQLAVDTVHEFTLLFGVRHEHGLLYREEFERLAHEYSNFRFWPTLSRPEPGWTCRTGHVQRHIFEAIGERRDVNVYICGLKEMVNDVRALLKANGLDRKQIFYEKYD